MAEPAIGYRYPDYLEPDPHKREVFCPMVVRKKQEVVTVTQVRQKIIEAKNKTEVIKVLLANYPGINSDAGEDWWKKREKLGV